MALAFQDKVVIITGASNGIGAATAAQFAALGAKIANFDIRDPSTAPTDNRIDLKVDVSNEESVIAAVNTVVNQWGTIDVLCNVAGITDRFQRVSETTNTDLDRIMGINFNGPLYLMRHVIPHFLAKGGKVEGEGDTNVFEHRAVLPKKGAIINVCSEAALRGSSAGAMYTASKHALLGLSRNTAWMYAKEGIRTNVVFPGGVATNIMANSGIDPKTQLDMVGYATLAQAQALMPALTMPNDIARAIVFLAGADAVNGAELAVDHGWCQG